MGSSSRADPLDNAAFKALVEKYLPRATDVSDMIARSDAQPALLAELMLLACGEYARLDMHGQKSEFTKRIELVVGQHVQGDTGPA